MKKVVQITFLALALMFVLQNEAIAQKKKKKDSDNAEYFDESGGFLTKLWYGGGFNLGFSGNNFQSLFQIGISPMVGYKITDEFSIGPRIAIQYISYRENFGGGQVYKDNFVTFGGGAFSRYKIIPALFAHVEYERATVVDQFLNRVQQDNFFVGLGYTSTGSVLGYEISLLYNTNLPSNSFQQPFDIRIGLNYNF